VAPRGMSDQLVHNDDGDLLWGCRAIAKAIGRSERATFHMLEAGALPARKVMGRWVASRRDLFAALRGSESSS
jgi:hypothetical protein